MIERSTLNEPPTFCQCLYKETKLLYRQWLKITLALIGGSIGCTIGYYLWGSISSTLADITNQFLQFTNLIPWYLYLVSVIVLYPAVYAIGVCIEKQLKGDDSSVCLIALALLVPGIIAVIVFLATQNLFFLVTFIMLFILSCGLLSHYQPQAGQL